MKKEYSLHHTHPQSRFHGGNEVLLPKKFHNAWHTLFGNMRGAEIIVFVREINKRMEYSNKITAHEIVELQKEVKDIGIYEYERGV